MADPSNFVNFSDYLGLNDEAGNQMFDRIGGEGARLRDDVYGAIDAQENAGGRDGVAAFEVAGERTRKGLASYGEYMAALRDPARRQELMEKTYGKGSVSALDAALTQAATGTAGKMGAMRADQTEVDRFAKLRGERGLQNAQSTDAYRKADADYDASLAAKRAAHQKMLSDRDAADEDKRIDSYARQFDRNYQGNNEMPFDSYGFIDGLIGRKRPEGTQREYWRRQLGRAESTQSIDESMNTTNPGDPAHGFSPGEQGNVRAAGGGMPSYTKSKRWQADNQGGGRWVGGKRVNDKWGDVRDIYDPNRIKKWGE